VRPYIILSSKKKRGTGKKTQFGSFHGEAGQLVLVLGFREEQVHVLDSKVQSLVVQFQSLLNLNHPVNYDGPDIIADFLMLVKKAWLHLVETLKYTQI
jgi:hypothetical protein